MGETGLQSVMESEGLPRFSSVHVTPLDGFLFFGAFSTFCSHIYKHINEHKGILSKRQCSYKDFLVKNLVNVFKMLHITH